MTRTPVWLVAAILLAATLFAAAGCGEDEPPRFRTDEQTLSPERMDRGLVIILPGIEGESLMNHNIRRGLLNAQIDQGITIHRWGSPIPGISLLLNQTNVVGNRIAGKRVADLAVAYQTAHPGRPVHIIGHSGGGGIAVFAAESMPPGSQIDGIILLSASISAGYDMSKAIANCRKGAANFYCTSDVGLLVVGTTLVGTVDGGRGTSAGNSGFTHGFSRLYELEIRPEEVVGDPHATATRPSYVSSHVAPWVLSSLWPPSGRIALASAAAPRPARRAAPPDPPGPMACAGHPAR